MKKVTVAGIDVVKALYFSTASVVIVLVITVIFLIPDLKKYTTYKEQNDKLREILRQKEKQADTLSKEYNSSVAHNKEILKAFKNSFDEKRFISAFGEQFSDIKLEKIEELSENHAQVVRYKVEAVAPNPKAFEFFIERLKHDMNIIRVDSEIIMKVRSDEKLTLSFTFKVYNYHEETVPKPKTQAKTDKTSTEEAKQHDAPKSEQHH